MVSRDYPLLTSLKIHHRRIDELLFIPDAFMSRLATLRHLGISGAHVNLNLLRDLRSLELDYSFQPIHITVDDILTAVAQNPSLQSLALGLQSDISGSTGSLSTIHLPELHELALRGPSDPCVRILCRLKLRGRCQISFDAWDEMNAPTLQSLLAYLRLHCSLPNAPPIASLALQMDEGSSRAVDISFCTTSSQLLRRRFMFTRWILVPYTIRLRSPAETDDQCDEFVTAILDHIPVQSATLLDIRHLVHIGYAALQNVLRRLPALSVIVGSLGHSSIDGLFSTLLSRVVHTRDGIPLARITLDAKYLSQKARRAMPGVASSGRHLADPESAHKHLRYILHYCAAARDAGTLVDVLELANDCDVTDPDCRLSYLAEFPRGDLWRNLRVGFVRNGVMRNKAVVLEELRQARWDAISHGEVWDPEQSRPHLVEELDDPVALVGLAG